MQDKDTKNKEMENNAELEDLLKNIDNEEETTDKTTDDFDVDALLYAFVSAISGITKVVSEHTGLKSVALTDEDEKILKNALKPLAKYIAKLVSFFVFLPLITFTIGYTLRIVGEINDKKKKEKLVNNTAISHSDVI